MHITHAFDGNPKIDLNSKVIVRGKQKAVVKKLIYPEKKKDKAKKISYKWQWEDGTLGSGQWKDYIPKDDTAIETLYVYSISLSHSHTHTHIHTIIPTDFRKKASSAHL
jgi:hypothetical protein